MGFKGSAFCGVDFQSPRLPLVTRQFLPRRHDVPGVVADFLGFSWHGNCLGGVWLLGVGIVAIGAIASGIFHSVASALGTPRPETASFGTGKPGGSARLPPRDAGSPDPAGQKMLADLQSWILAQQGAGPGAEMAKARAAYGGASAASGAAP